MTSRNQIDELDKNSKAEEYSMQLIVEFLVAQGLNRTVEILKDEISSLGIKAVNQISTKKERILKNDVVILLNLIESSDHKKFFTSWESLIPQSIKELPECKKLRVYLHAYYATLPFRDNFQPFGQNSAILKEKNDEETTAGTSELIKNDSHLKQITNLNGTFVVEKPYQDKVPIIDEIDLIPSNDDDDDAKCETDSLEDESEYSKHKRHYANLSEDGHPSSAMNMFKTFLLEHGAEFSEEPEFLPYFALPFVENPKTHPTFVTIFQDDWVANLKSKLNQFLIKYSCGDSVIPEIVKICKQNMIKENEENIDVSNSYKDIKRKMHKLKRDHQKLVGVASELASALEKSVQGEGVELKSILFNCISIFPDLFPMHVSEEHQTWDQTGRDFLLKKQILHSDLDAHKIKNDLYNGSVKTQLLLLQALRWHITQSETEEREQYVVWLARHDVLNLRSKSISDFFSPSTNLHPLQQSVVRLLNAIASLNCGRDYIGSSTKTVDLLLEAMKSKNLDQTSENMIVATIQKLSLRKPLCERMIDQGMIDHLLNKLRMNSFNKYTLQYSTSMLMNLALNAPLSYWDRHANISSYMVDLLLNSDNEVSEFITVTLCCALRNEEVNKQCAREGLGIKIGQFYSKNKHNPTLGRQLDTLLKLHRREISPFSLHLGQNCEDELEDPGELDAEIDENDMVKGTICGDEFLEQYCLIFPKQGVVGRSNDRFSNVPVQTNTPAARLPRWATGK
ncbi:lisH domain-containing protein ARMC9-like [Cimex lectularius]|uniref:LisH domain-containing protein ARMC9 n=1 Tax=Cimex lectularius TaxID=79782 RepID=A0A8I6TDX6_CIMLE|nr:lisH domain-containing protein ARMC9-like [Cimex lectularius]